MVENKKIMRKMVEKYVENGRKLCGKWQKIIIMWKMVENQKIIWKMVENQKIMWKMIENMWKMVENYYYVENGKKLENYVENGRKLENYVENGRKLLLCGKWQKI